MTRRSAGKGADRNAQQKSKNPTQRHGQNHYVLRPAIFPKTSPRQHSYSQFHRDSSHRFHKTIVVRDTSTRHNACTRHDPTVHWATRNYITPLQIRFSTFFDTTKRLSGRTQRLVGHFPSRSFTFFHSLEHVTM